VCLIACLIACHFRSRFRLRFQPAASDRARALARLCADRLMALTVKRARARSRLDYKLFKVQKQNKGVI